VNWIRSHGGPLVVMPESSLARWWGAYGAGGEDDVDEEETHYWYISERVEDYADVVTVNDATLLVLANGYAPTCFLDRDLLFVQCLTSESADDIEPVVHRALSQAQWQEQAVWNADVSCIIFDSAQYGPGLPLDDRLPVPVAPGRSH
jgi:hypothetical protein